MSLFEQLNFPQFSFRTRSRDGVGYIWDDIRKIWLELTPEEWVRRHYIHYLTECLGVYPALISQEHPVSLEGMAQRADIVVYNNKAEISMVVECKASCVELTKDIFAQAQRYNSVLNARFIGITNGKTHYCFELNKDTGVYKQLNCFPDLSDVADNK